jgi:hypothetical protein
MIHLHVGIFFYEMPCKFLCFVCPHNIMYMGREVFMLLNSNLIVAIQTPHSIV